MLSFYNYYFIELVMTLNWSGSTQDEGWLKQERHILLFWCFDLAFLYHANLEEVSNSPKEIAGKKHLPALWPLPKAHSIRCSEILSMIKVASTEKDGPFYTVSNWQPERLNKNCYKVCKVRVNRLLFFFSSSFLLIPE